jgi:hypothetical protein
MISKTASSLKMIQQEDETDREASGRSTLRRWQREWQMQTEQQCKALRAELGVWRESSETVWLN